MHVLHSVDYQVNRWYYHRQGHCFCITGPSRDAIRAAKDVELVEERPPASGTTASSWRKKLAVGFYTTTS